MTKLWYNIPKERLLQFNLWSQQGENLCEESRKIAN